MLKPKGFMNLNDMVLVGSVVVKSIEASLITQKLKPLVLSIRIVVVNILG